MKELKVILFGLIILYCVSMATCDHGFEDYLENPYRELKLPPWSTMADIKKRYNELVKQHHPDKKIGKSNEKFMRIQTAYEKLKELRKLAKDESDDFEDETENALVQAIQEVFQYILVIFIIGAIVYFSLWISFKLYDLTWRFMMNMTISFIFIEKLIPHYFASNTSQYIMSFLVGLTLHKIKNIYRFVRNFLRKKVDKIKVDDLVNDVNYREPDLNRGTRSNKKKD